MAEFKVQVEKRMYATGFVTVHADNMVQAMDMVENQIFADVLKPEQVQWSEPIDEEYSFNMVEQDYHVRD